MSSDYPLTLQEFTEIYSKVPRLTVEVIINDQEKGIFLTKRDIEPNKGTWHIPGGTVYMGETLVDAVKRVAKDEIGIEVQKCHHINSIHYPEHSQNGNGWPIGMAFEIDEYNGEPRALTGASEGSYFKTLPDNLHSDQDVFLIDNGYLETA